MFRVASAQGIQIHNSGQVARTLRIQSGRQSDLPQEPGNQPLPAFHRLPIFLPSTMQRNKGTANLLNDVGESPRESALPPSSLQTHPTGRSGAVKSPLSVLQSHPWAMCYLGFSQKARGAESGARIAPTAMANHTGIAKSNHGRFCWATPGRKWSITPINAAPI